MKCEERTIEQVEEIVSQMGQATEFPVFLQTGKEIGNWKGVYNEKFQTIVRLAPKKYTLLQNRESFLEILGIVKISDLKFSKSAIWENSRRASVTLISGKSITPSDGKPIFFAIELQNSYDGQSAFRIRGVLWRQICSNGLMAPTLLGQVSVRHFGEMSKKRILGSLALFEEKFESIVPIIENAIQYRMTPEEIKETLKPFEVYGKKFVKSVRTSLPPSMVSRWELYNLLTNKSQTKKPSMEMEINTKAEAILLASSPSSETQVLQ